MAPVALPGLPRGRRRPVRSGPRTRRPGRQFRVDFQGKSFRGATRGDSTPGMPSAGCRESGGERRGVWRVLAGIRGCVRRLVALAFPESSPPGRLSPRNRALLGAAPFGLDPSHPGAAAGPRPGGWGRSRRQPTSPQQCRCRRERTGIRPVSTRQTPARCQIRDRAIARHCSSRKRINWKQEIQQQCPKLGWFVE
jgi:hypothetical protein